MFCLLVYAFAIARVVNGLVVPRPSSPFHARVGQTWGKTCQLSSTVSSNEDLKPGIDRLSSANDELMSNLNDLRQAQNFRLFSVDILASCEYMPQELFECYSETCEIYPVDEDDVRNALFV